MNEIAPGVLRLEKVASSGWCWNMLVVKLPGGGLLVQSPTWLGDDTFEQLDALGEVKVLFAPNNYHHLSLPRFRARYPNALAVASEVALPRLRAKGHEGVVELSEAERLLPVGARWLRCEGTKSGEAWLSLPGSVWLVCDAFFNVERPVTGLMGMTLRTLKIAPGLSIGKTYRWLALRDVALYRTWALEKIVSEAPRHLVPSHGEAVSSETLASRLEELVRDKLAT